MQLIDIIKVYNTVCGMSCYSWPYDLALAISALKREIHDEVEFFIMEESRLVLEYADRDEHGNIRVSVDEHGNLQKFGSGDLASFTFKDPSQRAEYEQSREKLCTLEAGKNITVRRVAAPPEIRPDWLEALEGFIEFITED